jgi:hypothetical protein
MENSIDYKPFIRVYYSYYYSDIELDNYRPLDSSWFKILQSMFEFDHTYVG